ncbi:nuclear transport factor 2 family protein [Acinetobacter schindleri]|uniref:YybH family protein n=1 Tax=Acinetobacter schindleri TaxID=108981 RepID=UPI00235FFABA|nr:nuclear transport factor 2 family protein [Acinetobacter schindleri]WDE16571.1 nuclear transport factor 2 family protein [Acinetobacter schindleri]
MKIFGDPSLGEEIVDLLHEWDSAITGLDIQNVLKLCVPDVRFFDLSTEVHGLEAYEQKWNLYKPYMLHGVTIQRHDVTIYVEPHLALIHGYVKLTPANAEKVKWLPSVKWCRTSLCLKKEQGQWKMVHQHISVPVEIETHSMKVLELTI